MPRRILAVLLLIAAAALPGCSLSEQPEHQAYAICMSLDLAEDGVLTLGIQIPNIGGAGSGDGGQGEGSEYAIFSCKGRDFAAALDLLSATVPRELELSELKLIVASEKTARSPRFPEIVEDMILTYHLYGAATVVVCPGEALDFIKVQKPAVGVRLSIALDASLEHYAQIGYVPRRTLFDLYIANTSHFPSTLLSYAATHKDGMDTTTDVRMGDALAGDLPRAGKNDNEFMGGAVMRRGVMAGLLTGREARWIAILCGQKRSFGESVDGKAVDVAVRGIERKIDPHAEPMRIDIALTADVTPLHEMPALPALEIWMRDDLARTLRKCLNLSADLIGLGEIAATRCATYADYQALRLEERLQGAELNVSVKLAAA